MIGVRRHVRAGATRGDAPVRVDYCRPDGPPRVPGQAALRAPRHADAAGPRGQHRRGRRRPRRARSATRASIKAQVKIGGRGKAGGIKIAADAAEAREHADGDPRDGHPRPHRPRGLIQPASEDRRRVLRRGRLRPLGEEAAGHALDARRDGHRGRRRRVARGDRDAARRSARRLPALPRPAAGVRGGRRRRRRAPDRRRCSSRCTRRSRARRRCSIEVNPLVITPDREVIALDAKVTLDDNALYPPSARTRRSRTPARSTRRRRWPPSAG